MKKLLILLIVLGLSGCGKDDVTYSINYVTHEKSVLNNGITLVTVCINGSEYVKTIKATGVSYMSIMQVMDKDNKSKQCNY